MAGIAAVTAGVLLLGSLVPITVPVDSPVSNPAIELLLGLSNSQSLCDPLAAVASFMNYPFQPMLVQSSSDLHGAVHEAAENNNIPISRAEHVQMHETLATIEPDMTVRLATMLHTMNLAHAQIELAWSGVTLEERAYIATLPEGESNPVVDAILAKVEMGSVLSATCGILKAIEAAPPTLPTRPPISAENGGGVPCANPPRTIPGGNGVQVLAVGDFCDDTYSFTAAMLSYDPGGDDTYLDQPGYAAGTLAGGNGLRMSVALDEWGADHYGTQGNTMPLGSGQNGAVGILVDRSVDRDEHWGMNRLATGMSTGIGFVYNEGGLDDYRCSDNCEGAGFTRGVGLLWDAAGQDYYNKTSGSGQGYGEFEGGIGILLDQSGNDTYVGVGGIQGAADLGGAGVLLDKDGNDTYSTTGDDSRASATPATGTKILIDEAGTDTYLGPFPHGEADGAHWGPGVVTAAIPWTYIRGHDCDAGQSLQDCLQEGM